MELDVQSLSYLLSSVFEPEHMPDQLSCLSCILLPWSSAVCHQFMLYSELVKSTKLAFSRNTLTHFPLEIPDLKPPPSAIPSEFQFKEPPTPSEFQFREPPLALRIPKSHPWCRLFRYFLELPNTCYMQKNSFKHIVIFEVSGLFHYCGHGSYSDE